MKELFAKCEFVSRIKDFIIKNALILLSTLFIIIDIGLISKAGNPYCWENLGSFATFIGVEVAIIATIMAWRQIRISNSLRKTEAITRIYTSFITDDLYDFYERIRKGEKIEWNKYDKEEMRMNNALTLFDELCFLQTQKLFQKNDIEWEYIASELYYFAANESVWDYWAFRVKDGKEKNFPNSIIPFTGFSQLYETIPDKFKANPFPEVPQEHKALYKQITSS
ncbi:MAG: hypothetical protein ABSA26_03395 [Thermoguttaceae bacterium]|jgi:hypothetical protein